MDPSNIRYFVYTSNYHYFVNSYKITERLIISDQRWDICDEIKLTFSKGLSWSNIIEYDIQSHQEAINLVQNLTEIRQLMTE